jgi:hypothetical protein
MAREASMGEREIFEAALIGLQSRLSVVDDAISEIRRRLGQRGPRRPEAVSTDGTQAARGKRRMSAAARKRIGEATRRRWEAFRNSKPGAKAAPEKPKRKLSKAGRAAIIAATKKRWAAVHKAQRAAAKNTAPAGRKVTSTLKTRKPAGKTQATVTPVPATT